MKRVAHLSIIGITLAVAALAVSASASAQDIIGTWDGRFHFDVDHMVNQTVKKDPKADKLKLRNVVASFASRFEKLKIQLEFKTDGTMTSRLTGGPEPKVEKGTWRLDQQGDLLKLTTNYIEPETKKSLSRTVIVTFIDRHHFEITDSKSAGLTIKFSRAVLASRPNVPRR